MTLTYLRNGETLSLDRTACTGCGRCVEVCPHDVFGVVDGKAEIQAKERCMECGACARNCAAGSLRVRAGVGCAAAVISGLLLRKEPSCGCSDGSRSPVVAAAPREGQTGRRSCGCKPEP